MCPSDLQWRLFGVMLTYFPHKHSLARWISSKDFPFDIKYTTTRLWMRYNIYYIIIIMCAYVYFIANMCVECRMRKPDSAWVAEFGRPCKTNDLNYIITHIILGVLNCSLKKKHASCGDNISAMTLQCVEGYK